jgi:hypothetical protein
VYDDWTKSGGRVDEEWMKNGEKTRNQKNIELTRHSEYNISC